MQSVLNTASQHLCRCVFFVRFDVSERVVVQPKALWHDLAVSFLDEKIGCEEVALGELGKRRKMRQGRSERIG